MNRIYVISNDGRVFFAEPNDSSFELLDYQETNEKNTNIKIKRLSSSSWCFWSISSNFHVYLYVYSLDTPLEHQEITFENQRRYNLFSSNSFTNKLLFSDRPNYSSEEGDLSLPKDSFQLPSNDWTWKSDWTYEQNASDGWEYAVDFPTTFFPAFFLTSCVRRRKWTRTRVFNSYNRYIPIESPKKNDCIIDVSIGGWLIPFCEKGFLSVWAVSSSGKLFFRKNVSHSNPKGREWIRIYLPDSSSQIFSCSCSSKGDLWIVNDQGNAIMRTGITRETPWGTGWLSIDQPTDLFGIKEIGIGNKTVWILNSRGNVFYRAGITNKQPQGTKWVFVPTSMSNISVSSSDQLWAINFDENYLYIRSGIDEENLSGTGWKKINLKYKKTFYNNEDNSNEMNNEDNSSYSNFIISDKTSDRTDETSLSSKLNEQEDNSSNKNDTENSSNYNYYEYSIYDEQSDVKLNLNLNENETNFYDEKSKFNQNMEINVNKYLKVDEYSEIVKTVEETNKNLDELIENLIKEDDQELFEQKQDHVDDFINKSRSDSVLSKNSNQLFEISSINNSNKHGKSFSSFTSTNSNESSKSIELTIDLHGCNANSFSLDCNQLPVVWFDSNKTHLLSDSFKEKCIKYEWRENLLNDIKRRNLKEFLNIDKITNPYENDTFWSRKEEFLYYHKNRLFNCIFEIKHEKIDKHQTNSRLHVKTNDKSNIEMTFDFKSILLASRYVLDKKKSSPCFAIYLIYPTNPYIFIASSQNKLNEWVNQISIYCSKSNGFSTLLPASTIVSMEGFSYYAFTQNHKPIYLSQIEGHFKIIEKHITGVTYGLGENGKLWFLNKLNNTILDSYKGPYVQTDELETFTYENQRWNAVSGMLGLRNGFTKLGLPTDRYPWSDETGKIRRRKEDFVLPSSLFNWCSSWQVDFSLQPGVDKEGWQYAFDFPNTYHAVHNPIKDFVRRRRWVRKCRITTHGLWKEINQTHKLSCIAFDQELPNSLLLDEGKILLWATDSYGFILSSLIDETNPSLVKWRYISSHSRFKFVSIGVYLRIWAIDLEGNVYYRQGVDRKTQYCGTSWDQVYFDEEEKNDVKFKMISVGFDCVWAISKSYDLYFRQNVTKSFPQGTNWIKIDSNIKYVSVNSQNEVYVITSETARSKPNSVLYRNGISKECVTGKNWIQVIPYYSTLD